ncbi:MAG TPA: MFS transporter [Sediminibacterium sp.]|nr:MFS transporter [Sediminibacterium sp.]
MKHEAALTRKQHRFAVLVFFFVVGLCFASWASRIPDLKNKFHLSDGGLGALLFVLPVGSMLSMPLSAFLVGKYGSKKVVLAATILYPLLLIPISLVTAVWQLVPFVLFFGMLGNLCNISINTQAVGVEALYGRSIMASFHGTWSLAGFTGAAVGAAMVSAHIIPFVHYCIVVTSLVVMVAAVQAKALQKDHKHPGQRHFAVPDGALLRLGFIAFSSMVCEGTMFDWSGVYFQKVVAAPAEKVTLGYAAFMATMAGGRFLGDKLVGRFGKQRVLQASGVVITSGLLLAVLFPNMYTATLGFLLVGIGVSSVVPLVYSSAGKSKKLSPGLALTAVSSIGFLGFLVGPPLIGFIAQAFNLRWSFTLIALLGMGTTVLSTYMEWD